MDEKNQFGGFWTQQKIDIFVKYLFAYLEIMKRQQFNLIYFDGFAGCGRIDPEDNQLDDKSFIESVAMQVLSIDHPKSFDIYYMVDKHKKRSAQLSDLVKENFPDLKAHVVRADCNDKLVSMTKFMKKNPNYRTLAFIDPFGMSLNWSSLEACSSLGIDMWILIPTGLGVNRLLKRNQEEIPESWFKKLEKFYGMSAQQIKDYFYKTQEHHSLFSNETFTTVQKTNNSVKKAVDLYKERLGNVWQYVSNPFPMRNSTGSVMYHFLMATNNPNGLKIANEIIGKKLSNT